MHDTFNKMATRIVVVLLIISLDIHPQKTAIAPPSNLRVVYSEKSIDLSWDPVAGAQGYTIYTSAAKNTPKKNKVRINQQLITSGTHFAYLWDVVQGKKVKRIKGYEHHIVITAVFVKNGKEIESAFSQERDNCYFEGFRNIDSREKIQRILVDTQRTAYLPMEERSNPLDLFARFMQGPGSRLRDMIKGIIDPKETGGCVPVSTIAVKLMDETGLSAYRIDGTFIEEFHSFIMITIEGREYVLDFTADQFIPDVSPVMIPRDYCFLNEKGRLDTAGRPVYSVNKVYNAQQIDLTDSKDAALYREIWDKIKSTMNR